MRLPSIAPDVANVLAIVARHGNDDANAAERAYLAAIDEVLPGAAIAYAPPVDWAGTLAAKGSTDAHGSFSGKTFAIPSGTANGSYTVSATGVTSGALLDGVRIAGGVVHTHTLVMNSASKTVREVRMKRPL